MTLPLQNRVAPDGSLNAVAARGTLTGNRGILHDPETRTLTGRRWTHKAWIACTLSFKDRKRPVWGRQVAGVRPGWTELFFLDEVTALAAGHRPCFECRREQAVEFLACAAGGLGIELRAPALDALLHGQRRLSSRSPKIACDPADMPDGAVVEADGRFYAMRRGKALPWSFAGYGRAIALDELAGRPVTLVTPPAVIAALRAGYRPAWHASAA